MIRFFSQGGMLFNLFRKIEDAFQRPETHGFAQARKSLGLFWSVCLIHLQLPEIKVYLYISKYCATDEINFDQSF